jgi:Mn-dependent DtxR family transcriptional regulator
VLKLKLSPRVEEYLEFIYRLERKIGSAKTSVLAKQVNVALGTITNTVKKLEEGFIHLIVRDPVCDLSGRIDV